MNRIYFCKTCGTKLDESKAFCKKHALLQNLLWFSLTVISLLLFLGGLIIFYNGFSIGPYESFSYARMIFIVCLIPAIFIVQHWYKRFKENLSYAEENDEQVNCPFNNQSVLNDNAETR
jgi:magnesium-transporting ATPase (P-type)